MPELVQPIRVLVVDDHRVVREGLRSYLGLVDDIEVVGEASDGRAALDWLARAKAEGRLPDVVLMDLMMQPMDGIAATAAIRGRYVEVEVVAVTSFVEEEKVHAALEAGAAGYLLKDAEADEVAAAHYLAGRLVGLRFRGYGVRGTDHPEVYPPGIRQLMQAAPFYVTLSTKDSREQAGRWARAIYFAAGETSTAVCSITFAAVAAAANIPGGQMLLIGMIVFNAISTVVTTRNPTGDYGKALRALRG